MERWTPCVPPRVLSGAGHAGCYVCPPWGCSILGFTLIDVGTPQRTAGSPYPKQTQGDLVYYIYPTWVDFRDPVLLLGAKFGASVPGRATAGALWWP